MVNKNMVSAAAALALAVFAIAACEESSAPSPSPLGRDALRQSPDGIFCGGFAGFTCPEGLVCIDDPSDDCHPERGGGADCGGICVEGGEPCGESRCLAEQFCCNPSCGICAPAGGACIQMICD